MIKSFRNITKEGRLLSQLLFLGLTVWVSIRFLRGVRGATVEKYCPFGGVETLVPWLNKEGTICSLSTTNITILIGLLVLTLLFKRVFCSHVCPLGTLLEWAGLIGRRFLVRKRPLPRRADKALKWLKYPLLLLIIVLTVKAGELVFRDFDPYYVLFTAGKGHGIGTYGVWITAAVFALGLILPLSFCKFLCPLAACLAPFGRVGLARVYRDEKRCTGCNKCDEACAWDIEVSKESVVSSAECSNCQDCVRACPEPGTLALRIGRGRR